MAGVSLGSGVKLVIELMWSLPCEVYISQLVYILYSLPLIRVRNVIRSGLVLMHFPGRRSIENIFKSTT